MRRYNYELSRVMGMKRWLTIINATETIPPASKQEKNVENREMFGAFARGFRSSLCECNRSPRLVPNGVSASLS